MRDDHAEELQRQINKLFALMEDLKTVEGGTADSEYGATSTVTGFSGTPTVEIRVKKAGKLVFVRFNISGTSNATGFSFTVPYTSHANTYISNAGGSLTNNGTVSTTPVKIELAPSSATVNLYRDFNNLAWTNSGSKNARGEFFYVAA